MIKTRTSLGDYVTTEFGNISDGTPCEHVTIECTQPLRIVSLESKGKSIYERPIDAWSGTFDVKRIRGGKRT